VNKTATVIFERKQTNSVQMHLRRMQEIIKERAKEGWQPTHVNGVEVVGICEACSSPIVEGESYAAGLEGECLCSSCIQGDGK